MFSRLRKTFVGVAALAVGALSSPLAHAQASWEEAEPEAADSASDAAPVPSEAAVPAEQPQPGAAAPAGESEYADTDPAAISDFKPELDPYGTWVQDPKYGLVWIPDQRVVGADFAPYVTSGHWALTPEGDWIWASDYPFGWVTFHYGRWVWVPGTGWAWIAGRQYANAWVVWRVPTGDYAYVGWAPAPPSYVWVDGAAVTFWYAPPPPFIFCPSAYVFSYRVHHHIVYDRARVHQIAHHTHRYVPRRVASHRGPSLATARVPADRVPSVRTPAHPRAIAAARPTASSRRAPAPVAATGKRRATPGRALPAASPTAVSRATPNRRPGARPASGARGPTVAPSPTYRSSSARIAPAPSRSRSTLRPGVSSPARTPLRTPSRRPR